MKSKIPCKECIALAICRLKVEVTCNALVEYADTLWKDEKRTRNYWDIINDTLPNLGALYDIGIGGRGFKLGHFK